jgi:hypothetical protein
MKRSFWITLFASVAACAGAMTALNARNENLAKRLDETPQAPYPAPDAAKTAPAVGQDEPSNARVERAVAEIKELILRLPPPKVSQEQRDGLKGLMYPEWILTEVTKNEQFSKIMPSVLEAVRNLSVEELIAAAGQMADPHAGVLLLTLAVDQDPMRVLRDETLLLDYDSSREMRETTLPPKVAKSEVLAALAKVDPAAALRELPPLEQKDLGSQAAPLMSNPELSLWVKTATHLISTKPELALATMLEVKKKTGILPVGVSGLSTFPLASPSGIPALIKASNDSRYAEISAEIIGLAAKSALHHQGIGEMAGVLEAMKLSPEKLNEVTNDLLSSYDLAASQPVATLDWLSRSQPEKVTGTFIAWAKQDQASAADWLINQPPSPQRDNSIARFAREAFNLDPETATAWAQQIQDEELRNETLEQLRKK